MTDVTSHTEVEIGSNKSFGLVFAAVFAIIAFWPLVFHGSSLRLWALTIAAIFLAVTYLAPQVLKPLNRVWFLFGMLINKIVTPLVMGIIFVSTVVPIGLIRRMLNPDPMNQKFDPSSDSYWAQRDPEMTKQTSMRKQF